MSGKIDKKEKISGGDLNNQQNDDKKNQDHVSNTQTNNEETEKEDVSKQTNGENSNEYQDDEHKNDPNAQHNDGKKNEDHKSNTQTNNEKIEKEDAAKQTNGENSDKLKNSKKSSKDHTAKHKKDGKADKSKEKKDGEKKSSKENNGKKNTKNHSSKHKKSRSVTFDDDVKQSGPLSGGFAMKVQDVAGLLKMKATDIQSKKPIDWTGYRDNDAITDEEFSFINTLQYSNTKDERDELIQNSEENGYYAIAKVLDCVQSVKEMQKLLVLLHDFLAEEFARVELMNKATPEVRDTIQQLLASSDDTIRHMASQVLTKLLFAPNGRLEADGIKFFLGWLDEGLDEYNPYLQSVATCLQKLLQVDDYRLAFVEMDGINKIIKLLTRNLKTQIQYQLCFCLWVSTFNVGIAGKMNRTNMIPIVMDLLERCPSEITKLPRVVIALIRNLLEKPQSEEIRRHNAMLSIQCKILQYLELLEPKIKNVNDEEFSQDFEEIRTILSTTVMEASSFEEYLTEVRSGHLIWSVVHTSQNFWVDNAERFNDNDHELLKTLISFLENSDDTVVLCIAAHDLGEYMKQYIRGKTVVENLGGKEALIKLLECTNQGVKYQALKCLQMLMLDKHDLYSEFQTNNRKIAEMCCIMEE